MRALLTGFEGWKGNVNPSGIIAKNLNDKELNGLKIIGRQLPEDFYKLHEVLRDLIREVKPEIVIGTGWDYVSKIKVERVALNVMNSVFGDEVVPDNYGHKPAGEKVIERGPVSLLATLPAEKIVENVNKSSIPAFASYQAGTHCCNTVMYSVLYNTIGGGRKSGKVAGFIHIPPIPEMNVKKGDVEPMDLEKESKAITIALETCRDYLKSSRKPKKAKTK
jgi:pyroglutamyl-peptidase